MNAMNEMQVGLKLVHPVGLNLKRKESLFFIKLRTTLIDLTHN